MVYKAYNLGTYNLYTIKTDRFKTCHMEIIFRNNIKKDEITKRNVLSELLVDNSKKYNDRKKMNIALEELYDSSFYCITNKLGSCLLTNFCFDFINPNLVNESIEKFIKFPIECILNPNVENNEFDKNSFSYIVNKVKNDIESIIEDPKYYSINKLLSIMCPNSDSSINMNGYAEDLDYISSSNLYEYYKNMLEHDYVDIYIIGNLDMDNVFEIVKDNFKLNVFKDHKVNHDVHNKSVSKVKVVYDNLKITQENICVGLNIDKVTEFEHDYVSVIYNMLLGNSSLDTKLYKRLRNDNSLCYNVLSLYKKYDNIIIIHTAVAPFNEKKAISLIKKALKDMINDITDEEIDNIKESITNNLNMSLDSPERIVDNYLFKNEFGYLDICDRIKMYKSVTKEDIIKYAKKVKINTILCVRDGENEKDKNR